MPLLTAISASESERGEEMMKAEQDVFRLGVLWVESLRLEHMTLERPLALALFQDQGCIHGQGLASSPDYILAGGAHVTQQMIVKVGKPAYGSSCRPVADQSSKVADARQIAGNLGLVQSIVSHGQVSSSAEN